MDWPTFGNNTEARRAEGEKAKKPVSPPPEVPSKPLRAVVDTTSTIGKIRARLEKEKAAMDE